MLRTSTLGIAAIAGCQRGGDESPTDRFPGGDRAVQPAPVRNPSRHAGVVTSNGQVAVTTTDVSLPGRDDVNVAITRRYDTALLGAEGDFGRGHCWTYAKRLVGSDGDAGRVDYYDGAGNVFSFSRVADGDGVLGAGDGDEYHSPLLYAVLEERADGWVLHRTHGRSFVFEPPAAGGRLTAIRGKNDRNAVELAYDDGEVRVTGPLGRTVTVRYDGQYVSEVEAPGGRTWTYEQDASGDLVAIGLPNGGTAEFGYDGAGRITSTTSPAFDEPHRSFAWDDVEGARRVVRATRGRGRDEASPAEVAFDYERRTLTSDGYPVFETHVAREGDDSPTVHLVHDESGHVTERTVAVATEVERNFGAGTVETFLDSDLRQGERERARLVTTTAYNAVGEWVERTNPAGDRAERRYDLDAADPRDRGNLLERRRYPAPNRSAEQEVLRTKFAYGDYQFRSAITDPSGNTTDFEYDESGNLTERTHPPREVPDVTGFEGAGEGDYETVRHTDAWQYNEYGLPTAYTDRSGVTYEYRYYPEENPTGEGVGDVRAAATPDGGGFLAVYENDAG